MHNILHNKNVLKKDLRIFKRFLPSYSEPSSLPAARGLLLQIVRLLNCRLK